MKNKLEPWSVVHILWQHQKPSNLHSFDRLQNARLRCPLNDFYVPPCYIRLSVFLCCFITSLFIIFSYILSVFAFVVSLRRRKWFWRRRRNLNRNRANRTFFPQQLFHFFPLTSLSISHLYSFYHISFSLLYFLHTNFLPVLFVV